eukprot:NODE_201_length_13147_cov_1.076104.p7 type:complete len:310 gc:universal NODE_201_length_13147_cov_1.076104:8455-9384(+)
MGGNALTKLGIDARRITRDEYRILTSELLKKIQDGGYYQNIALPEVFPTKESFGDIDILVQGKVKEFGISTKGHTTNGNVHSFEYKGVQVDLIEIKNSLNMAKFIYSWGEFGQYLGMNARKYGFRTSCDGLFIRDKPFFLSSDPQSIMKFFDLNIKRYEEGFTNSKEVHEFFYNSKYFCGLKFKKRERYRDVVLEYCDFVEEKQVANNVIPFQQLNEYNILLQTCISYFDKQKEFDNAKITELNNEKFRKAFNGDKVKSITGLDGKNLGNFMQQFLEVYDKKTISDKADLEIEELIRTMNDKFNLTKNL